MTGFKINKFLGEAPRMSPENLPDSVAQIAIDCKLYSGDLIPYATQTYSATLTKAGAIKTIYPMESAGTKYWLHWTEDVDIVRTSDASDTTQRIYCSGASGGPQTTNFSLATTGVGDYPIASYKLGVVAPTTACTTVGVFPTSVTITYAAGLATATAVAHGRSTGDVIFVSGANESEYNVSAVITRTGANTFTYPIAGAPTSPATGTITYAFGYALAKARTYVYTWVTDWDWESAPSLASTSLKAMDGQQVNISGLPTTAPAGYGNVITKRLYRTVSGSTGTHYYEVADVALATSTYSDPTRESALVTQITSDNYDEPAANMIGLTPMPNGILAGFFDNVVCFSEPYKPWAWPIEYRKTVDYTVAGITAIGTSLVIATTGAPYFIAGNHPSAMSISRPEVLYPCLTKRSVVNMGWGVLYAAPDGLVKISGSGNDLATKLVYYRDQWLDLVPSSIVATYYIGKYFASYSLGSFVFEQDERVGGIFIEASGRFTAGFFHQQEGVLYYVDTNKVNQIYKWDDVTATSLTMDWKSKVYVTPKPVNFGAALVQADYIGYNQTAVDAANTAYIDSIETGESLGSLNDHEMNLYPINGDEVQDLPTIPGIMVFQLYADKKLRFQRYVYDDTVFRLPSGYKSDTWEVRILSPIRARYILLGETPEDLAKV